MEERVINEEAFVKMACGNVLEFRGMAQAFVVDLRLLSAGWKVAGEDGFTEEIYREIHRCKGGASLFAMERVRKILAGLESGNGAALEELTCELKAAEEALAVIQ